MNIGCCSQHKECLAAKRCVNWDRNGNQESNNCQLRNQFELGNIKRELRAYTESVKRVMYSRLENGIEIRYCILVVSPPKTLEQSVSAPDVTVYYVVTHFKFNAKWMLLTTFKTKKKPTKKRLNKKVMKRFMM